MKTERDAILQAFKTIDGLYKTKHEVIFSFLVWMDGMSGYLENPPKVLSDIAYSKDEMMHDEWERTRNKTRKDTTE